MAGQGGGRAFSASNFLPSTFEERGAVVPFTTPLLAFARVRKDYRDRIELSVPRFTDAAGQYVIPWTAIAEIATLTTHDTLLHQEIVARHALDPHTLRLAALSVAATGLAGPEVAAAVARAVADDDELKALNHLMLMLRLIEEVEERPAPELLRRIATAEGQDRVRGELSSIAEKLGLATEIFDARLNELASGSYALGMKWSPREGRLRHILQRLSAFHGSLLAWSEGRISEAAEAARFCADVVGLTLGLGSGLLGEFDLAVASPRALVMAEAPRRDRVRHLGLRLAWLLDGWVPLIELWAEGVGKSAEAQALLLQEILPVLPLVPRDELGDGKGDAATEMTERTRRWVRPNEDWLTGEIDAEMIERLEKRKAKAA